MRFLSVSEIIFIHTYALKYGGSEGIRDLKLLESSAYRPQASFGGTELYVTLFDKAASLMYSLIKNHPFIDGNKRTGMLSGTLFLRLNGYTLTMDQNNFYNLAMGIATNKLTVEKLAKHISKNSKKSYK